MNRSHTPSFFESFLAPVKPPGRASLSRNTVDPLETCFNVASTSLGLALEAISTWKQHPAVRTVVASICDNILSMLTFLLLAVRCTPRYFSSP